MRILLGYLPLNFFLAITLLTFATTSSKLPAQSLIASKTKTLQTQQHALRYEEYGNPSAPATITLLHGASGPDVPPYRAEAEFFAAHGHYVLLPHYFDVTSSPAP